MDTRPADAPAGRRGIWRGGYGRTRRRRERRGGHSPAGGSAGHAAEQAGHAGGVPGQDGVRPRRAGVRRRAVREPLAARPRHHPAHLLVLRPPCHPLLLRAGVRGVAGDEAEEGVP